MLDKRDNLVDTLRPGLLREQGVGVVGSGESEDS